MNTTKILSLIRPIMTAFFLCLSAATQAQETALADFTALRTYLRVNGGSGKLTSDISYSARLVGMTAARDLTLNGNGKKIDAAGNGSALPIKMPGQTINISNLTITAGAAGSSANGGGLYNSTSGAAAGTVNLTGVKFLSNTALSAASGFGYGGGIYLDAAGGAVNFYSSSVFTLNSATNKGGALFSEAAHNITFNGTAEFKENSALGSPASDSDGGAIYLKSANAVNKTGVLFAGAATFTDNQTERYGGAIFLSDAAATFNSSSIFDGNTATANGSGGGALYLENGANVVFAGAQNSFVSNSSYAGGALFISAGTGVDIQNSGAFTLNSAASAGGAALVKGVLSLGSGSVFASNTASGNGAAISILSGGEVNALDTSFSANAASGNGGAVYLLGDGASKLSVFNFTQTDTLAPSVFLSNTDSSGANSFYLDNYSRLSFEIAANSVVELHDGISSSAAVTDALICISGAGDFDLYGTTANYHGAMDVYGNFNVKSGAALHAGAFNSYSGSVLNLQNGAADTVTFDSLSLAGTLKLDIFSDGTSDLIVIENAANISGGALEIKAGIGEYQNVNFKIFNAKSGLAGIFASDIITPSGLTYTLDYSDPQWISIVFSGAAAASFGALPGLKKNTMRVAQVFDILSGSNPSAAMTNVINGINAMPQEAQSEALTQTTGYFLANIMTAKVNSSAAYVYNALKQRDFNYEATPRNIWFSGGINRLDLDAEDNSPYKFKDNSSVYNFGFDYLTSDVFVLGFFGEYRADDIKQGASKADINSAGAGIYSLFALGDFALKSYISANSDNYKTKRNISFNNAVAQADFTGTSVNADAQAQYKFPLANFIDLKVFAGAGGGVITRGAFKETGADALDLSVAKDSFTVASSRAGLGLEGRVYTFGWRAEGQYNYYLTGNTVDIEASFAGTDVPFSSKGAEYSKSSVQANAGIFYDITKAMRINLDAAYQVFDNMSALTANAAFLYMF